MNADAHPPLLLHACCAPCSGPVIEHLLAEGFHPTVFFYNPNIYPQTEYELRKASVIAFARKLGLDIVDVDNDPTEWERRVKGLEKEPERGERCSVCFDVRLERAASHAAAHSFPAFATTNGVSRFKDQEQVDRSGHKAAARHPGLTYYTVDWRKNKTSDKIKPIAMRENFYQQKYCGCRYSL